MRSRIRVVLGGAKKGARVSAEKAPILGRVVREGAAAARGANDKRFSIECQE